MLGTKTISHIVNFLVKPVPKPIKPAYFNITQIRQTATDNR